MPNPDKPISFGYKISWLACREMDPRRICSVLAISIRGPIEWKDGLKEAYLSETSVFITPPIQGWTLIAGCGLSWGCSERETKRHRAWMENLSAQLSEVQYFSTHRVVEWHVWSQAKEGRLLRRYAYLGEEGRVVWNDGKVTAEEEVLNLDIQPHLNPDEPQMISEEEVMSVAEKWSVDPISIADLDLPDSLGLLGTLSSRDKS